jgi:hypothetical protein
MTKEEFKSALDKFWEEYYEDYVRELKEEEPKHGYEEANEGEPYYFVNVMSKATLGSSRHDGMVDGLYAAANYFSDRELCERVAFEEGLIRKLRRFAAQEADGEVFRNGEKRYLICFDYDKGYSRVGEVEGMNAFGEVLFLTRESAQKAIDLFAKDLYVYFNWEWSTIRPNESNEPEVEPEDVMPNCAKCVNYDRCRGYGFTDAYRDRLYKWNKNEDCFRPKTGAYR